MKLSILLPLLFITAFGFSQRAYRLVNKTNCDLNFNTYVVESGSCNDLVSNILYTVPAHSSEPFVTVPGAELRNLVASFVVNNCVGMNLAAPTTSPCANCFAPYLSSYSFTPNCNNRCQGTTFNLMWFEDCNGGETQLVIYQ